MANTARPRAWTVGDFLAFEAGVCLSKEMAVRDEHGQLVAEIRFVRKDLHAPGHASDGFQECRGVHWLVPWAVT